MYIIGVGRLFSILSICSLRDTYLAFSLYFKSGIWINQKKKAFIILKTGYWPITNILICISQ